ncbi:hypothetical protein DT87_00190 [Streptomyces sp. NTK 937]|nr:hypothetical protein DT87_00190 [Streptomyces sp. NTK 937]
MTEQWRDVTGFPGYRVSDEGRIRGIRGHVLRPGQDKRGYARVVLMKDRTRVARSVHRLVLTEFVGEPPGAGAQGAHLDGNPRNNCLSNLAWTSSAENHAHRRQHGTDPVGERNGRAVLSAQDVIDMRQAMSDGMSIRQASELFGISYSQTSAIRARTKWRHI